MRRVASLYLPFLSTDRIRRREESRDRQRDAVIAPAPPIDVQDAPEIGTRIADCSCPRGGGWRPGARWARAEDRRAALQAEIAQLPLHQRPPMRELGRRSEAAEMPFKRMSPDEGGVASPPRLRGGAGGGSSTFATRKEVPPPTPPAKAGGELIVTVSRTGQRVVLAALCRNAAAMGLSPGMPLTQARAMVQGLEVHDADPVGDSALLDRIGTFAARRLTPLVAPSGADGLWLDLTGAAHLHGGERQLCVDLLRFCSKLGLGARIAVAGNGAAAHALARHGPERLTQCAAGDERAAILPLPLAALRLDQGRIDSMRRLGLERVADLVAMPRGPLVRRFGAETLLRLDQALGQAAEPFDPILPRDAPSVTLSFAEPIGGAEPIANAIDRLIDQLIESLREKGLGARALLLLCARVDKHQERLEVGAARATRDKAHWLRLIGQRVDSIDPGFGIDTMRLVAARVEPLGAVAVPGDLAAPEPVPDLAQLIDLIAGRIGARHLYRLSLRESDVPERSVRKVGPLDDPLPWPDDWPRPPRLLPNPEPVHNVLAELPDAPPRRFTWRGKTHRLVRGDGPERIHGEWWKRGGERDSVRDYFRVEDESGARFWLFRRGDGRDPRTGDLSWWVQGGCG